MSSHDTKLTDRASREPRESHSAMRPDDQAGQAKSAPSVATTDSNSEIKQREIVRAHGEADRKEGVEPHINPRPQAVQADAPDGSPESLASEMSECQRREQTETLIQNYHADVYRYAFWLSGDNTAAEDVTQETFIRAFRGLQGLRDPASARAWLLRIARNEFLRTCRKKRDERELPHDIAYEASGLDGLDNADWLGHALSGLAPEYRNVLMLFYFEQLSYEAIAEALGIPMGTVMSRLNRGRKQLRASLEQSDCIGAQTR